VGGADRPRADEPARVPGAGLPAAADRGRGGRGADGGQGAGGVRAEGGDGRGDGGGVARHRPAGRPGLPGRHPHGRRLDAADVPGVRRGGSGPGTRRARFAWTWAGRRRRPPP
jgi:hypothetical protein